MSERERTAAPSEVFGHRMRDLRKAQRLSQHELVRRVQELGVPMNQPGVSRIEAGSQGVSLDEAVAVAAVLGVTPEDLYRSPLDWNDYRVAVAESNPNERPPTPDEAWLRVWATGRRRAQEQASTTPTKEDE